MAMDKWMCTSILEQPSDFYEPTFDTSICYLCISIPIMITKIIPNKRQLLMYTDTLQHEFTTNLLKLLRKKIM